MMENFRVESATVQFIHIPPAWENVCSVRTPLCSKCLKESMLLLMLWGRVTTTTKKEELLGLGSWEPHAGYGSDFRLLFRDPLSLESIRSDSALSSMVTGMHTQTHIHVHLYTGTCAHILTHLNNIYSHGPEAALVITYFNSKRLILVILNK